MNLQSSATVFLLLSILQERVTPSLLVLMYAVTLSSNTSGVSSKNSTVSFGTVKGRHVYNYYVYPIHNSYSLKLPHSKSI